MSEASELLTVAELATLLRVRPTTIRKWARDGKIPSRRLSRTVIRFSLSSVLHALGLSGQEGVAK